MAEMSEKPRMDWRAPDLKREFRRFKQHCKFTFDGPLNKSTDVVKVNYLMTYMGDRGREVYSTFDWAPATGTTPAENATLEGVWKRFESYVEPKNQRNQGDRHCSHAESKIQVNDSTIL